VWILEADIEGCFDHISHPWLLDHVPMDREVLRNYRYQVMGKENNLKVYRLKHLVRKDRDGLVDLKPLTARYTLKRTEIIARLNANRCEYCDKEERCEVHHVRKLKDLARKREKTLLERMMMARRRKTMVLCPDCHDKLHSGRLPDWRYVSVC
jgi:RNA-directed DNA polymerase